MSLYRTTGDPVTLYATNGSPALGDPEPPTPPPVDEGTDPATLTLLRQVTNNTAYSRMASPVDPELGTTVIVAHKLTAPAKALVLQYTAIGVSGGNPITAATVIRRAGISIAGTYHPALFNGLESVTVAPGTMVRSDALAAAVQAEAGATVYTVVELSAGYYNAGTLNSPSPASSTIAGPFRGTVNLASNSISRGITGLYGLTVPDQRPLAVVGVGDSFMDLGWFRNAAEASGLAWSDWSVWLDTTHTTRLLDRMPPTGHIPYDIAFVGWGGNDRSLPLADWQAASVASWRLFVGSGQRVACKTLHPYTASTDGWTSTAGQTINLTPEVEANRVARNNWLRDGAPIDATDTPLATGTTDPAALRAGDNGHPLAFPVFDEADTLETSRNSGLWRSDGGAHTNDGTHLTAHGNTTMTAAMTAWMAAHLT